jgi:hypothetical protein
MPLETVHVAFCDCTDAVHAIGAFPTLAAAHAARREECGDDGGFVADTTYRTDGPTGWAEEYTEGCCDRLMVHTDAYGEPNAAWSVTAPYGEGNEDGTGPLYVVTLGSFSSDDLTVYVGPDHAASIAAATGEADR